MFLTSIAYGIMGTLGAKDMLCDSECSLTPPASGTVMVVSCPVTAQAKPAAFSLEVGREVYVRPGP